MKDEGDPLKKLLFLLFLALGLLLLAACDALPIPAQKGASAPASAPTAAPEYIWTVSVDGTKAQRYGDGQLSANYTVHLSASKAGGDSPLGEYRGELRVDYEGVPDEATLFAIELLGGTYDFEGWGENDAFTFTMEPYDHAKIMDFVAAAYQGEGARTAPLMTGVAMYMAEDIPFAQSDWAMGLNAGLAGVFGVDAEGDETGASSSVYSPFGSGSASSNEIVPLRCSLHFPDESRVQFNIWSHGKLDVNLSFEGTLDKVPLANTIPAA